MPLLKTVRNEICNETSKTERALGCHNSMGCDFDKSPQGNMQQAFGRRPERYFMGLQFEISWLGDEKEGESAGTTLQFARWRFGAGLKVDVEAA